MIVLVVWYHNQHKEIIAVNQEMARSQMGIGRRAFNTWNNHTQQHKARMDEQQQRHQDEYTAAAQFATFSPFGGGLGQQQQELRAANIALDPEMEKLQKSEMCDGESDASIMERLMKKHQEHMPTIPVPEVSKGTGVPKRAYVKRNAAHLNTRGSDPGFAD